MIQKLVEDLNFDKVNRMTHEECVSLIISLYNDNLRFKRERDEAVANMLEYRKLANADNYIPSTEQMMFLFPEIETIVKYSQDEITEEQSNDQTAEEPKKKERKPRKPALRLPKSTPRVVMDYTEFAPETIERDGITYKRGENKVIEQISYVPSKKIVELKIYPTWNATCEVEGDEKKTIIGFRNETVDKISCAPSMAAHMAVSKYDDHLPLYRQSEMLERDGLEIQRQTLCSWLMKYYSTLIGFEKYFGEQIFKMNLINQDETPVEVLSVKSASGKISSSSFVIIRVGTTFDEKTHTYHRMVHMTYSNGRSRKQLFEGFIQNDYQGPFMTDGLKGYLNGPISDDKHSVCWVHAVRKLKKFARSCRSDADAYKILSYHGELYTIESNCRALLDSGEITPAEFLEKRKKAAEPVIKKIIDHAREISKPEEKTPKQEAISYILEYEKFLYTYLNTVECSPDNNECERRAKAFATGRKNWLFSNTIDGADTSCFFYSLIETAKACGINPERYLEYVLTYGPYTPKEEYEKLLPWNADLDAINNAVAARINAVADPDRKEDYILTGFSR